MIVPEKVFYDGQLNQIKPFIFLRDVINQLILFCQWVGMKPLEPNSISHHAPLPALQLQLLLDLSQLGLQGGDGGLEFGAALALSLLQFGFQLSVLSLQLLPGSLPALSGGSLSRQLGAQLLHLDSDSQDAHGHSDSRFQFHLRTHSRISALPEPTSCWFFLSLSLRLSMVACSSSSSSSSWLIFVSRRRFSSDSIVLEQEEEREIGCCERRMEMKCEKSIPYLGTYFRPFLSKEFIFLKEKTSNVD